MAKRNIRKTDAETTSQPEARRRTTPADGTAPRASRSRRNTDPAAPVAGAAADTKERTLATQAATTPNEAKRIDIPHEHIAVRAYHIYLSRGARPGDQFADWITAERELREQAAATR